MTINQIVKKTMDCAFNVHRELGPGLYESAYESCFCHELGTANLDFKRQVLMPLVYRGVELDPAYRIDVLVENRVVVEVKAVAQLHSLHSAQLLTYMRFGGYKAGLLFNFNSVLLKDGMKRLVLNYQGPKPSG